jgi:hypothetical protein
MNRSTKISVSVGLTMLAMAAPAWAATSTTLAQAVPEFDGLFRVGLYILGLAGLMTIAYVVARNRYGMTWDEAISIVAACALGASAITILGWVGVTAAATLPLPPLP